MQRRILYLPGLDGVANVIDKLQPHLPDAELVPFSYPAGRRLTWVELADLVAAKLQALETRLLMGESFGGAVALKASIAHRGRAAGLFLVSAFSSQPEAFAAALGRTATRVLPRGVMKPVARLLAGWKLAGTLSGEDRERFLKRYSELDYADIAERLRLLADFDVDDRLVGLCGPVDVLFGSEDPIAGSQNQRELWQRVPDVKLHQMDAYGYLVSHEVPIGVAARIRSWLQRVEDADAG